METPIILNNDEDSFEKKHFNLLVLRVRKLKQQTQEKQLLLEEAKKYISANLSPYSLKLMDIKQEVLFLLDKTYQSGLFTFWEKTKLHEIISRHAFDLAYRYQNEEAEVLYKKYEENAPDKGIKDLAQFSESLFKSFWGEMFEPQTTISTKEKPEQNAKEAEKHHQADIAEETDKPEDPEKKISQTLKSLYNHLAKKLHPDLEIDPIKKEEKNEIMQRVTIAYKKNDIFELLHIASMQDANLSLFQDKQTLANLILLLKNQVRELEFKHTSTENEEDETIFTAFCTDGKVDYKAIDAQKNFILKECENIKRDLEMFSSPENLRRYLRTSFNF